MPLYTMPDVIEQAKTFKDAGIQFIHVVDLDGALDGRATNRDLIAAVSYTHLDVYKRQVLQWSGH